MKVTFEKDSVHIGFLDLHFQSELSLATLTRLLDCLNYLIAKEELRLLTATLQHLES